MIVNNSVCKDVEVGGDVESASPQSNMNNFFSSGMRKAKDSTMKLDALCASEQHNPCPNGNHMNSSSASTNSSTFGSERYRTNIF